MKKQIKKKRKYRFKDNAVAYKYESVNHLLEQLRVMVERGEAINSIGNLINKTAGFAVYKPVEVHTVGGEFSEDEIKEIMDKVDALMLEVKKKQGCYQKEQKKSSK